MRYAITLIFLFITCFLSAQSLIDSLIIEDELLVYYDSDSFTLSTEDVERIESFAVRFQEPIYRFKLDAHTDSDGSDEYNFMLSRKRCNTIKKILITNNIPVDRITYSSHGEKLLLKAETDKAQKAKNRRATLRIYKSREFISFKGSLAPKDKFKKITGDIYVSYEDVNDSIKTDPDGVFKVMLPANTEVEVNILSKGYFPFKKNIFLSRDSHAENLKINLTKYDIDNSISTTIQFVGDKSIVLDQSFNELEFLGKSLIVNDKVCVELEGHINRPNQKTVSKNSRDHGLSIARAIEIFLYLVDQSVPPDRLLARGYGNSKMLYPKANSAEQQSANRRVEVKVISCDSTRLIKNDFVKNLDGFRKIDFLKLYYDSTKVDRHLEHAPEKVKTDIKKEVVLMLEDNTDPTNFTYMQILQFSRNIN